MQCHVLQTRLTQNYPGPTGRCLEYTEGMVVLATLWGQWIP